MNFIGTASSRPTLPPLRALNLPIPNTQNASNYHDVYDYKSCHIPWNYDRQVSISSSVTSRSPSPDYFATRSPCSLSPLSSTPPPSAFTSTTSLKVRLVPCSFEHADAYIYIPPSSAPPSSVAPKAFDTVQGQLQGSQPLLLVGSAARQLRQSTRKIAKGARLHPYRVTRSTYRPPKKLT